MTDVLMMSLSTDSFLPQLTLEFFNFMEFLSWKYALSGFECRSNRQLS